ncbi:hypothetical protein CHS0354_034108 [Potamilus streckersoni]|uniref:Uncharacterized protein n=1 Tax=Potamilus streckersoni TaxID=2493646 RepID=A0AAE0TD16_9BIVA|nr:hypothetical protein CHS0354_034108 [Potamilus streckersoni]
MRQQRLTADDRMALPGKDPEWNIRYPSDSGDNLTEGLSSSFTKTVIWYADHQKKIGRGECLMAECPKSPLSLLGTRFRLMQIPCEVECMVLQIRRLCSDNPVESNGMHNTLVENSPTLVSAVESVMIKDRNNPNSHFSKVVSEQ